MISKQSNHPFQHRINNPTANCGSNPKNKTQMFDTHSASKIEQKKAKKPLRGQGGRPPATAIAGKVIAIKEIVQQSPKRLSRQPGHVKKGMFITMLEEFPPGRLAGLNQCLAKQTRAIADSVVIDHQKDDQGHPPTLTPQGITDLHHCRYG
jgi:hypothetical protein